MRLLSIVKNKIRIEIDVVLCLCFARLCIIIIAFHLILYKCNLNSIKFSNMFYVCVICNSVQRNLIINNSIKEI